MRRPVLAAVAAGAVLLVLGRAFAFVYTESAWYSALGAGPVWTERLTDSLIVQVAAFVLAAAFALTNFSAVRHSILSLVLPRRLGNVEFAEAVAPRRLDLVAVALAVGVAGIAATAAPEWRSLALVRTGARFRETDPYHQLDISFYTSWLPFEMQVHRWAWLVVLVTAVVVTTLYALTPGLRWENGMVRMTGYVRRHLSTLVAVLLLMLAWRARLTSYTLLFDGSGPEGAFTAVDHRWLLPANVILGIGTIGGAALFLWGAWSRQTTYSFVALTGVIVLWVAIRYLLPLTVRTPTATAAVADQPYAETREAFTRRAFEVGTGGAPVGTGGAPVERQPEGVDLSRTPQVARLSSMAHIAPGARGYLIVSGPLGAASPALTSPMARLAHAWEEQDRRLLGDDLPPRPAILRIRDVSERVRRVAPVFEQGTRPAALFRADTLYWVIDLYTASSTYPLSRRFVVAGERRGYFRQAGSAYVNGTTGAVSIVLSRSADALARAWQRRFPQVLLAPGVEPHWIGELALQPSIPLPQTGEADSLFRARVRQFYLRMRAALSTSDLRTFGDWFDSLGALLRSREADAPPARE